MSSPQAAAAPGSAKAALTCACRILASHGIQLEAETLRQAKFNTPTVSSAMFQAVHDLVLLNVLWSSGLHTDPDPAARVQAASHVWKEVQQEGTPGMTVDGLILVCYYLQQWGCPGQIVQDLEQAAAAAATAAAAAADSGEGHYASSLDDEETGASRFVGSRLSLLALAWLLQRCRLFEAAVGALHPGAPARALLPPLPHDSCLCEATRQSYLCALQRGAAHGRRVLQLLQPAQQLAEEQVWPLVELAAHSAIMLLGKARASLSSLQSLLDARLKLQQALRQAQPGVGSALSPLELHLLLNKQAMQAHLQALGAAAAALEQQQELASCARLFFSWMASVVAEEAKGRGVALSGDAPAAGPATGLAMLESLQRLPECGSHLAASLLQHLDQQLQEAVEATQPWLSTCRTSERLSVYQTSSQAKQQAKGGDRDKVEDVNLAHFQRLASQALAAGAAAAAGPHPAHARAEGSHAAGCLPAADWSFPSDLTESLQHLLSLQGAGAGAGRRQELSDLVHASACLKHEIPRAEDGVAQSRSHLPGDLSRGSGEPQPGHVVQGTDETDRLLRSTLQCGKALAQTRAANKQAMLLGLAQMPPEFQLHWPC